MQSVRTALAMRGEQRLSGEVGVDGGQVAGPRDDLSLRVEHQDLRKLRHAHQLVAQPRHRPGDGIGGAGALRVAQDQIDRLQRRRRLLGEQTRKVGKIPLCAALRQLAVGAYVPDGRGDVDRHQQHAQADERPRERNARQAGTQPRRRHPGLAGRPAD
jgi:hypothetical protein